MGIGSESFKDSSDRIDRKLTTIIYGTRGWRVLSLSLSLLTPLSTLK